MKVVKLRELCQLPAGTLFTKWEPAYSSGLFLFCKALPSGNDFFYQNLEVGPSEKFDEPEFDAPFMRWGIFDDAETFAVFEDSEVTELITILINRHSITLI